MITLLEEGAPTQATSPARLEWPTPHHFRVLETSVTGGPERATVAMVDGRKLAGSVVRLDTSALILEFRPDAARVNLMIEFSAFKSVCLSRTIALERVSPAVPAENVTVNPTWKTQVCTIKFKDGSELVADALGAVARPSIQARAKISKITRAARAEGMLTLKQDGLEKVLQGHTDLVQVQAVCV